jgi:hypothetical protein
VLKSNGTGAPAATFWHAVGAEALKVKRFRGHDP